MKSTARRRGTQSALLEAMSEEQVSIEAETRRLERRSCFVRQQNPFEFEGTYYLPENQLDRFLLKVGLGILSVQRASDPDDAAGPKRAGEPHASDHF